MVRVALDDVATRRPAGGVGRGAFFTSRLKASLSFRKILLRQEAILNYVSPF